MYNELMKKWKPLHLTLNNSKSEVGPDKVIIRIKLKIFKKRRVRVANMNFAQKGAVRIV